LRDFDDVVFLEEADGGDPGGSGFEAGLDFGQSDTAEGQDWDIGAAGFTKKVQTRGLGVFLFEDWGEDCERC
jgi:hypothetical protein